MKYQTVYKVVRKAKDGYYSALGNNYPSEYDLEYELNKITKSSPDSLGILVFKNIENAVKFVKYNLVSNVIFVCFVCKASSLKRIKRVAFISFIKEFYYNKRKPLAERYANNAPPGTYACQSLKPIRLYQNERTNP